MNCLRECFQTVSAKVFSCGENKCAYVACHGLRPFFLSLLHHDIEECENYVILFDESANDYLYRKQMDVHVRYWHALQRVATRYYMSVLTHGPLHGRGHSGDIVECPGTFATGENSSSLNGWTTKAPATELSSPMFGFGQLWAAHRA